MNSNKKLTPRDGDSTVISHILTSGKTPVEVVIDKTKAKSGNGADVIEGEIANQTRGEKTMHNVWKVH